MPDDDAQDEQVRRLLADARHTGPIPADVADRLDGVLADLRADRPVRPAVTDLAAARRRRRARAMLVAAAAVIVVGLGVNQLRGSTSGSDDQATSGGGDSVAAEEAPQSSTADGFEFDGDDAESFPSAAARVDSDDFGRAALQLRDQAADRSSAYSLTKARCTTRAPGAGTLVPIRYDGSPAILVYRPPRGETQVVDLYVCGREGVVRTITLPAR